MTLPDLPLLRNGAGPSGWNTGACLWRWVAIVAQARPIRFKCAGPERYPAPWRRSSDGLAPSFHTVAMARRGWRWLAAARSASWSGWECG